MFFRGNAALQAYGIIIGQDRHARLRDDAASIDALINVMHGAAAFRIASGDDGFVHMQAIHARAAVSRQERRVQVDDFSRKGIDDLRRADAQESGEYDKIAVGRDGFVQGADEGFAWQFAVNQGKGDVAGKRVLLARAVAIGNHAHDARGQFATVAGSKESSKIGSAARNENGELRGHGCGVVCKRRNYTDIGNLEKPSGALVLPQELCVEEMQRFVALAGCDGLPAAECMSKMDMDNLVWEMVNFLINKRFM